MTADNVEERTTTRAAALGFKPGERVVRLSDPRGIDWTIEREIERLTGHDLIGKDDEDEELADVGLLWRRNSKSGIRLERVLKETMGWTRSNVVCLITPAAGHDGHFEPEEIDLAAMLQMFSVVRSGDIGTDWVGARLTPKE